MRKCSIAHTRNIQNKHAHCSRKPMYSPSKAKMRQVFYVWPLLFASFVVFTCRGLKIGGLVSGDQEVLIFKRAIAAAKSEYPVGY